jgi:hypothetical protein
MTDEYSLKMNPNLFFALEGQQYHIARPFYAQWNPQPDITAYEIAILLPYFVGAARLTREIWQAMGPERRHLTDRGDLDPWTGLPVSPPPTEGKDAS